MAENTLLREQLEENPHVLVVCTGNICRSPMGEIVLRQRFEEAGIPLAVTSAAVSDEEEGNPLYPPAVRVLAEHNYPTRAARLAHRVTDDELAEAGLILAMTTGHARALRRRALQAGVPVERIHLWREFDGTVLDVAPNGVFGEGGALAEGTAGTGRQDAHADFYFSSGDFDVPDPWGGTPADFDATLEVVERGADGLVEELRGFEG